MNKYQFRFPPVFVLAVILTPFQAHSQGPLKSGARVGLPFPPESLVLESAPLSSDQFVIESQCGPVNDSQDVELYDGTLGPTKGFVVREEPSTVQFQWISDLSERFSQPGDSPGNVAGVRWCTGTLIAEDLLITAAHCFRVGAGPAGWLTPRRAGMPVLPAEIATLMQVNFNYQVNGETSVIRTPDVYPIVELVEFGDERGTVNGETLDYAVVRIGVGESGKPANAGYPMSEFSTSREVLTEATMLTMIQHPHGAPKKVEAGTVIVEPRDVLLRYGDLDTLGGSSGSGILDQQGVLVGVHTNGGCTMYGGYNYGVTLNAIAKVSGVIK